MNRIALATLGALLTSAALVIPGSGPAAALSPATDSPAAAVQPPAATAGQNASGFRAVGHPGADYLAKTCLTDLSTVPQGTSVTLLVNLCGFEVEVTPATIKESVPATWQRWGQRPRVENPRPDVLWTNGSPTLTLSWPFNQNHIGGVEIQPREDGSDVYSARYFSGPNGTGTLVGTVIQRATSPGGAHLVAARSATAWQSIVITSRSGNDFAIAQIRSS